MVHQLTDSLILPAGIKWRLSRVWGLARAWIWLIKSKAPLMVLRHAALSFYQQAKITKAYKQQKQQFQSQIKHLKLTNDWFTANIPQWLDILNRQAYFDKPIEVLEIGSWEGLSSYFVLHTFPKAHVTCVDTWEGADEHQSGAAASHTTLSQIESTFKQNLAPFNSRLKTFKGTSYAFFNGLSQQAQYDLIYIDGSHYVDDVLIDAIKGFEHLKVGGLMVFDDYLWAYYKQTLDNPAAAIHAFLKLKKGSYQFLAVGYQVWIQKLTSNNR